jgi:hypothetical protein
MHRASFSPSGILTGSNPGHHHEMTGDDSHLDRDQDNRHHEWKM